jgi:hypothetical protein
MLLGLHKNLSEYLTSKNGVYCEKNQTDSEKKICEGTLKTNNELGGTLFAYFD